MERDRRAYKCIRTYLASGQRIHANIFRYQSPLTYLHSAIFLLLFIHTNFDPKLNRLPSRRTWTRAEARRSRKAGAPSLKTSIDSPMIFR